MSAPANPAQWLVLDQGNTSAKLAWIDAQGQVAQPQVLPGQLSAKALLGQLHQPTAVALASVGQPAEPLAAALLAAGHHPVLLSGRSPGPVVNAYTTPQTLGVDRWAAVQAGWARFGKGPYLVLDAGTALTWDAVDAQGRYLGGGIAPGLAMQYQALHAHSHRLPKLWPLDAEPTQAATPPSLIGTNTQDALRAGVEAAQRLLVQALVQTLRQQLGGTLPVLLTGGDAHRLDADPQGGIFADPHLVLRGLFVLATFAPAPPPCAPLS